jgi:hypothetical protein
VDGQSGYAPGMSTLLLEVLVALCLVAVLWFSTRLGGWFAQRVKVRNDDMQQLGVVQTAMLGLLALLLGFSYSGAMTRFVARQDLMLAETNAVGTAWLRADLIENEADRTGMKDALRRYTDARIELFEKTFTPQGESLLTKLSVAHADAWARAVAASRGGGAGGTENGGGGSRQNLGMLLLPPLNDVADLMTSQNAARARHLPTLIMVVIFICACGSVASVGFSSVFIVRKTNLPAVALVVLIAAAIWLIIDLDFPRLGLIRIDHQTLIDLRESMGPATR